MVFLCFYSSDLPCLVRSIAQWCKVSTCGFLFWNCSDNFKCTAASQSIESFQCWHIHNCIIRWHDSFEFLWTSNWRNWLNWDSICELAVKKKKLQHIWFDRVPIGSMAFWICFNFVLRSLLYIERLCPTCITKGRGEKQINFYMIYRLINVTAWLLIFSLFNGPATGFVLLFTLLESFLAAYLFCFVVYDPLMKSIQWHCVCICYMYCYVLIWFIALQ